MTAPLGVGRVVRRARWVKHREWFYLVEALYPLGSPKRIHPPQALGGSFSIVLFCPMSARFKPYRPFRRKVAIRRDGEDFDVPEGILFFVIPQNPPPSDWQS